MPVDCSKAKATGKPWYMYSREDGYGQPNDGGSGMGNFSKPDSNINAPSGTAITALSPGTVTSINTGVYWGDSVTIKLDSAFNRIATHSAYNFIDVCSNLSRGEHVNAGDVIGIAGKKSASPAFAFWNNDEYGSGSTWSTYYANNAGGHNGLNPINFLNDIVKNGPQSVAGVSSDDPLCNVPGIGGWLCAMRDANILPRIGQGILGGLLLLAGVILGVMSLMGKNPGSVIKTVAKVAA